MRPAGPRGSLYGLRGNIGIGFMKTTSPRRVMSRAGIFLRLFHRFRREMILCLTVDILQVKELAGFFTSVRAYRKKRIARQSGSLSRFKLLTSPLPRSPRVSDTRTLPSSYNPLCSGGDCRLNTPGAAYPAYSGLLRARRNR